MRGWYNHFRPKEERTMEEVIRKILEALKENQEDWLEIEFAEIKNEEPDAEDLEEYSLDAYNAWEWEPKFETWCAARSEAVAYRECLEMIFEALGKDREECNEAVHKVCQEAKEEAIKKVKSGESEWLDEPWGFD